MACKRMSTAAASWINNFVQLLHEWIIRNRSTDIYGMSNVVYYYMLPTCKYRL